MANGSMTQKKKSYVQKVSSCSSHFYIQQTIQLVGDLVTPDGDQEVNFDDDDVKKFINKIELTTTNQEMDSTFVSPDT